MNKKKFISRINIDDSNLVGSIYEKYSLCIDTGMKVGTEEFYSPDIWSEIENLKDYLDTEVEVEGAFEFGERKRIYFIPKEDEYYEMTSENVKMTLLNKSDFKELKHKDYLGALMSLGIKRELISDLVVKDNKCYFMTNKIVSELILANIRQAGRNPVEAEILEENFLMPSPFFEEETKVVASTRLDVLVSALANISRKEAVDLINSKKVSVNYRINTDKSFNVKEDSVIIIRKGGKFIFEGEAGKTKKDKLRIKIKKFI